MDCWVSAKAVCGPTDLGGYPGPYADNPTPPASNFYLPSVSSASSPLITLGWAVPDASWYFGGGYTGIIEPTLKASEWTNPYGGFETRPYIFASINPTTGYAWFDNYHGLSWFNEIFDTLRGPFGSDNWFSKYFTWPYVPGYSAHGLLSMSQMWLYQPCFQVVGSSGIYTPPTTDDPMFFQNNISAIRGRWRTNVPVKCFEISVELWMQYETNEVGEGYVWHWGWAPPAGNNNCPIGMDFDAQWIIETSYGPWYFGNGYGVVTPNRVWARNIHFLRDVTPSIFHGPANSTDTSAAFNYPGETSANTDPGWVVPSPSGSPTAMDGFVGMMVLQCFGTPEEWQTRTGLTIS